VNVVVDESAKKTLRKLDEETRRKIGREIQRYQAGLSVDFKKIKASVNRWRIAVGDWRIFLTYDPDTRETHVTDVMQRKNAYR